MSNINSPKLDAADSSAQESCQNLQKNEGDISPAPQKSQNQTQTRKIITISACVLIQLCVGILYLWSIFNKQVQADYAMKESAANLVSSFMMLGFVLGNLLGGFLQDKTNPRLISALGCLIFCSGIILTSFISSGSAWLIYFTYSGMGGVGCGFVYGSILSCMQKWFPDRRGFASGLSVAAFGLSTVLFAPVAQYLLPKHGAPNTFLILGLIFLAVTALCCIFVTLPKSQSNAKLLSGMTPKEVVKKLPFWCIALTIFFFNATWNILIPIIKPLGEGHLSTTAAAYIVMAAGLANVAGRFSMASLSDKIGRESTVIISTVITLACAIALIWAKSYTYFGAVILTAFAFGGPSATLPALCTDTFGSKYGGTNYGMALLGLGLSSITFTYFSNLLKSATGSYTASFIMAATTCLIPLVLMPLYKKFKNSAKAKNNTEKAQ